MIIDMTSILRGMGMIATSPSPWHRFWQMLRITKGWWIRPFKGKP